MISFWRALVFLWASGMSGASHIFATRMEEVSKVEDVSTKRSALRCPVCNCYCIMENICFSDLQTFAVTSFMPRNVVTIVMYNSECCKQFQIQNLIINIELKPKELTKLN